MIGFNSEFRFHQPVKRPILWENLCLVKLKKIDLKPVILQTVLCGALGLGRFLRGSAKLSLMINFNSTEFLIDILSSKNVFYSNSAIHLTLLLVKYCPIYEPPITNKGRCRRKLK
jgi:hypothetical protein